MKYLNHWLNKLSGHHLLDFNPIHNMGAIFCLHRVIDNNKISSSSNQFIEISKDHLERLIIDLIKIGVEFVSIKRIAEISQTKAILKKPIVHFTFDDGYMDNYTNAFPLFKKYEIPFSVFPTTSYLTEPNPFVWWYLIEKLFSHDDLHIDESVISIPGINSLGYKEKLEKLNRKLISADYSSYQVLKNYIVAEALKLGIEFESMLSWDNLKEMIESGLCEIGAHSISHFKGNVLSKEELKNEILGSIHTLESKLGIKINDYAYPFGSYNELGDHSILISLFKEAGIRFGFTTEEKPLTFNVDQFFMPRIFLNNDSTLYSLKVRLNGFYFN